MNAALLQEEPLLPVAQAAKLHPAFRGFHPASIQRWARKGIKRGGAVVRLESIRIGQALCTSRQALDRFLVALNASDEPTPVPRSPAARKRASARAEQRLIAEGV
jgi:hypothetical protein